MSEISNVLVYALKIKYNYILSLYFKTCTKGLKGGGGSLVDKGEGRGRSDNKYSPLNVVEWPILRRTVLNLALSNSGISD